MFALLADLPVAVAVVGVALNVLAQVELVLLDALDEFLADDDKFENGNDVFTFSAESDFVCCPVWHNLDIFNV